MQFYFPEWVQKVRGKKAQASARLRYILARLAIEYTDSPSVRGLCVSTGLCGPSVVSAYINQGAFSPVLAEKFEKHFGASVINAKALIDPMSIGSEGPAAAK